MTAHTGTLAHALNRFSVPSAAPLQDISGGAGHPDDRDAGNFFDSPAQDQVSFQPSSPSTALPSAAEPACSMVMRPSVQENYLLMQLFAKHTVPASTSTSARMALEWLFERLLEMPSSCEAAVEGIQHGQEEEQKHEDENLLLPRQPATIEESIQSRRCRLARSVHPQQPPLPVGVTTLVIRNIPRRVRNVRDMLFDLFKPKGFANFLHVPYSKKQRCWARYAFINCLSHRIAVDFCQRWRGCRMDGFPGPGGFVITAAKVQGLEANLRFVSQIGADNLTQNTAPIVLVGDTLLDLPAVIEVSVKARALSSSWGAQSVTEACLMHCRLSAALGQFVGV